MEHYISVHIPSDCGAQFLLNGELQPVQSLIFHLDIHRKSRPTVSVHLQVSPQTKVETAEIKLTREGKTIVLSPQTQWTPAPFSPLPDMELADPKDESILLAHLESLVARLNKPLP